MVGRGAAHTVGTSIAVLPFLSMSGDPENEYFSDGITEEIINALTRIEGLKVTARTSSFVFKNQTIDVRTIGRRLGVSSVLEGSVRRYKTKVRITAQLIRTDNGFHIWSENFDRELEDIFVLQDEVSVLIAEQVREHFGHLMIPEVSTTVPTTHIEAYSLLLKGRYHFKRKDLEDIKKALHCFQQAIALDPGYAEAHAFMGETYLHHGGFGLLSTPEAHDKARAAAQTAIRLNPQEPRAHKVLAYIHLFYDWAWDAAQEAYNKAVRYGLPDENEFIAYYYIFIENDCDRAISVAQQVLVTDPLHAISHWHLGMCYYFAARYREAVTAFDNALALDGQFGEALRWRGLVLGYLGEFEAALASMDEALALSGGEGPAVMDRLIIRILMGETEAVVPIIQATEYIDPMDPAMLYALLKMPEEAAFWLDKGYQERATMLVTLKHFWLWDRIRDTPAFKAVYDRMPFDTRPVHVVPDEATASVLLDSKEMEWYVARLAQAMEAEQLYLDPALSLRQVAEHIGLHPNKLSWLLNERVGQNFNAYVNRYRLEAFKEQALDPTNRHLTLSALAYESGFNSKSVFNPYFKKVMGMTPRAWVKAQQT